MSSILTHSIQIDGTVLGDKTTGSIVLTASRTELLISASGQVVTDGQGYDAGKGPGHGAKYGPFTSGGLHLVTSLI